MSDATQHLMPQRWQQHRQADAPIPPTNLVWPFYGSGPASLGVEGRPVSEPFPTCGPDEIVVRVDALGLCASDAKMVRMGPDYPLFQQRDFVANPAQLGHEAALTVIQVGADWRHQYYPGQRLGIQPDVFNNGARAIFGVNIPGAMAQYVRLDQRVLDGDGGSYVFPVPDEAGDAEVALLEPWACVDVAYSPTARRLEPLPGGTLWIAGQPGDSRHYVMSRSLDSGLVVLTDVPEELARWVRSHSVKVMYADGLTAEGARALIGGAGFDDIILLHPPDATSVAGAVASLADRGTLNLVREQPLEAAVVVELNKLHYQQLSMLGCRGPDLAQAYGAAMNRSDLRPGGVVWLMGAGGAMGHMHLLRALQLPNRPRAIIATNRGQARLDRIQQDFAEAAATAGVELITVSPAAEPERLAREIARLTGGRGCDDIVVIAPDARAVAEATPHLAPDGMLVVFAGVQAGAVIELPLDWTPLYGAQFTGTSGSTVADQLRVLDKLRQGLLRPAQAVAAIGGMYALQQGVRAVLERTYPGKIVIFPQLMDLPLLSLSELQSTLPSVHALLGPGDTWNNAAEQMLYEEWLTREDRKT